jgi:AcrR family transcriptional regulator
MPRPKKTVAQLESTREQILDTALAILQESGPEAITSRAIAERMGVAHMSLFTYFENQAAILRALRLREMTRWHSRQQFFNQRAETEDIVLVVKDLLRFFIAFARENPNLYRIAWVMSDVGGETPEESRQRMQVTAGRLATLLQKGMESGAFEPRNPLLAAGTVLAMINTPFIFFYSGKLVDAALRDQMVEEVLSAALGYLEKK